MAVEKSDEKLEGKQRLWIYISILANERYEAQVKAADMVSQARTSEVDFQLTACRARICRTRLSKLVSSDH
jgi:hypothetical protein